MIVGIDLRTEQRPSGVVFYYESPLTVLRFHCGVNQANTNSPTSRFEPATTVVDRKKLAL